jgi:hypothetical protein
MIKHQIILFLYHLYGAILNLRIPNCMICPPKQLIGMLPNEIHYHQIKTIVQTSDEQTDQGKSVTGSSVDESVVKTNEVPSDKDKSVSGNSVDKSCKYIRKCSII